MRLGQTLMNAGLAGVNLPCLSLVLSMSLAMAILVVQWYQLPLLLVVECRVVVNIGESGQRRSIVQHGMFICT